MAVSWSGIDDSTNECRHEITVIAASDAFDIVPTSVGIPPGSNSIVADIAATTMFNNGSSEWGDKAILRRYFPSTTWQLIKLITNI